MPSAFRRSRSAAKGAEQEAIFEIAKAVNGAASCPDRHAEATSRSVAADTPSRRSGRSGVVHIEERGPFGIDGRHHQRAIEEVVPAFARALGKQDTAVTCRPRQKPVFLPVVGLMLRA